MDFRNIPFMYTLILEGMMQILQKFFIFALFLLSLDSSSFAFTRLFYLERTDTTTSISGAVAGFNSFKNNDKAIDIVSAQAYQIDEHGIVWGYVDQQVLDLAKEHSNKVMPLITNARFDKEKTHLFLQNPDAQTRATQSIVNACKQAHYYGVQLDFENVGITDKNQLTQFYTTTTKALHNAGFVVSIALPPMLPADPTSSYIQKKFYENWEAAYDFDKLGKISDFVTIMAYNQHGSGTTPGPTADIHWVETTLEYALHYIPAKKVSLGIPVWSDYWLTDRSRATNKITAHNVAMNYPDLMYLLNKFKVELLWDKQTKISYNMFSRDWLNQYVFAEDVNSFKAKVALAEKYHLHGISVYALGMEDPRIWAELTKTPH